jgi:putative transcriptional regulator
LYDIFVSELIDICFMTRDKLKRKIGQRIVELREQRGWSQSDLARACNKDRQAIEKLESGKVNPTLYTLLEIANALEISLSKLVDLS